MSLKLIPTALFSGLFLLFLMPAAVGIINLGNCSGMALSLSLAVICLFWERFAAFIGRCWEKSIGKAVLLFLGIGLILCAVLAVMISISMVRAAKDPPKDENTTVIVLGCKVRDGAPSLMLFRRLQAAYDYLSEHESVNVVVSGGQGSDEAISEAECMKEWLVGKGISPERIYMEDRSVNTEENLRFSQQIIKDEGLPEKATLITDSFHQLRAKMLAEKQGMETYSISGRTAWYILPTYWVREWFGVVYYRLFG
ncbi:MAG: YdcF family protein [Ruminococcus sp.]|uniref:YdcF family protein n=1 Tax=Ruminococcus sp. TaxID=41978 RepID=UPI0025DCF27A|nr:YdcF family protein [Ruminococcus sp.]MCR5599385.1 YdcF family protein [Ruminococcus sp.]